MLLPKNVVSLLHAVKKPSKKLASSYALYHIHVTEQRIWSSNGHSLYSMPYCSLQEELEGFLNSPVRSEEYEEPELPINIPAIQLSAAFSSTPKQRKGFIPEITTQVLVEKGKLTTTDLRNFSTINYTVECNVYPSVEEIYKIRPAEDSRKVVMSMEELEVLLKIMKSEKSEYVTMTISGPTDMVNVELSDSLIVGQIMPCNP